VDYDLWLLLGADGPYDDRFCEECGEEECCCDRPHAEDFYKDDS
jgi:hypothetical protein